MSEIESAKSKIKDLEKSNSKISKFKSKTEDKEEKIDIDNEEKDDQELQ